MSNAVLVFICSCFWLLLAYYSLLTVAGIIYRGRKHDNQPLARYPSVSVLIPAYNEGVVLSHTLNAMTKLDYPGELTIFVLNDRSTDNTGEIAQFYADLFANIRHVVVPEGVPKGKSRVLNYGLSLSESAYFAVYDADNQPEPDALRLLVEKAVKTPKAVGAVGYVKTINEQKNLLTRMISLEFQVFQLLMQAGRWSLFSTGSLTGTNMLVSRAAIERVGGYDPYALAEDADLTLTLTAQGGLLPIVPESVTWEQEPETFAVWLRQRTRWSQGNIYILVKALRERSWLKGRVLVHILQQYIIYVGFAGLLFFSDGWLIVSYFSKVEKLNSVPLLLIWFQSYMVYLVQLVSAQTIDRRLTPKNVLVATIMYCTYAQLFMVLLVKGMYRYFIEARAVSGPVWDKTTRFGVCGGSKNTD
ncbi:MAG TPA: glycosyltransferase [Patescibacteria group bacterium]|nr:glycosyltransferase [Patescibacteria group bacterium]